ncbi:hypothetical protein GGR54DRAFT_542339 [Hypoxylon sp. NC1633]|nr:hypothetical protein GGR54DRAFT_542339 [Hypoxylon sp. NC1633]
MILWDQWEMKWDAFPVELQLLILEQLAGVARTENTAALATVCRQWHAVLEKKHFEHIFLTQPRLAEFDRLVQGRKRKMVKHITLQVVVDSNEHNDLVISLNTFILVNDNTMVLGNTIRELFTILSKWERPRDTNKKGLLLEIRPHYNYRTAEENPEPDPEYTVLNLLDLPRLGRDAADIPANLEVQTRSLDTVPRDNGGAPRFLPYVDVVTMLLLRRRCHRLIKHHQLNQIFYSLISMDHCIYDPSAYLGCI